MKHLEVHVLTKSRDLDLANDAGLLSNMSAVLFGPTCDACHQMILLERGEQCAIVLDEEKSYISCENCLTATILDGILGA